jgi:hypothetical protein
MREIAGRLLRQRPARQREPVLSFGSWDQFPGQSPRVVQICHPDWRGVRTVSYAFRSPVVECDDLHVWGRMLADRIDEARVDMVVIQGWPPGSGLLAKLLEERSIPVKCLLHSSPVQHGAEPGEAGVIDEILGLASKGVLDGVGMAKAGVSEAFTAIGYPVEYVPNRVPDVPTVVRKVLGEGTHVGIFAEPFWRKNVTTQLLAVGMMDRATAHVLSLPDNPYLRSVRVVEHGELPYDEFISLQASVDLNLYVTLSECHPSTPQESYLTGVPCLVSRVSSVFKSDERLWDLTTVDEADNPVSIVKAAERLLAHREEALDRADRWMREADRLGAEAWSQFTSS